MFSALTFRRAFSSPSGHRWQWRHSRPLAQPCGFQNHVQGLHSPMQCSAEPSDGMLCGMSGAPKGPPGSSTRAAAPAARPWPSASAGCRRGAARVHARGTGPGGAGNGPPGGERGRSGSDGSGGGNATLSSPSDSSLFTRCTGGREHRRAPALALRRAFSSPSKHMWQWRQLRPFRQPPRFQNQAQGLQEPVPCRIEPTDAALSMASSSSCGSSSLSSRSDRQLAASSSARVEMESFLQTYSPHSWSSSVSDSCGLLHEGGVPANGSSCITARPEALPAASGR
mmetsp:Transcript_54445/g.155049  ORF Transcript_54445/g.155049 Transcript_54445/m.155049 type:complete len:283 (+) Transcript_54445:764-1612(+)